MKYINGGKDLLEIVQKMVIIDDSYEETLVRRINGEDEYESIKNMQKY